MLLAVAHFDDPKLDPLAEPAVVLTELRAGGEVLSYAIA